MNITEKIISAHCNKREVTPGDKVEIKYDLAVCTELDFPHILKYLRDSGSRGILDFSKLAFINGHLTNKKDAAKGSLVNALDEYVESQNIERYYQVGRSGECQSLLVEQSAVCPGDVIIGGEAHLSSYGAFGNLALAQDYAVLAASINSGLITFTTPKSILIRFTGRLLKMVTAKDVAIWLLKELKTLDLKDTALELGGEDLQRLSSQDKFTIANMLSESGAMCVLMPYFTDMNKDNEIKPDPDAEYKQELECELSRIVPMVAAPYAPHNGFPAEDANEISIQQIVVGGCSNGNLNDIKQICAMLENKDVSSGIRMKIYPSSHKTIRDMLETGCALFLTGKGVRFTPPSCQPCLGSGIRFLGENETGLFTVNRNDKKRHGPASAKVYISGSLVAAASAITGVITDPRHL